MLRFVTVGRPNTDHTANRINHKRVKQQPDNTKLN